MTREGIVIRRVVHDNQRIPGHVWQQLLVEPFCEEIMMHLAVIVTRFPCALQGQFRTWYPAALCHRMDNDETCTFACRLLYPRTIFIGCDRSTPIPMDYAAFCPR